MNAPFGLCVTSCLCSHSCDTARCCTYDVSLLIYLPKMDSDQEDFEDGHDNQVDNADQVDRGLFVQLIRKYKVVLEKSKVPSEVKARNTAWTSLTEELSNTLGKKFTVEQLKKLVNNMKVAVKKKTDKKATGNKKIQLKDWEKGFLDVMEKDVNPVFTKVPCSISVGVSRASDTIEDPQSSTAKNKTDEGQRPTKIRKTKKIVDEYECEETKNLSIPELQRLVLLQQFKLQKIQIEREQLQLNQLRQAAGHPTSLEPNEEVEEDQTLLKPNEEVTELDKYNNTDGDFGNKYVVLRQL